MYKTFYVPRSKSELIVWLSKHFNQTKYQLSKMPIKQLYAIYYRVRSDA